MKFEVITTITTLIDADTFETKHSTEIYSPDGVPGSVARAAALSGCKATVKTLTPDAEEN